MPWGVIPHGIQCASGNIVPMNNQKHIIMTLLGLAFLVAISIRGLALPILAKFEIGDVMIGNLISASSLGAIVLGVVSFVFFSLWALNCF